MNSMSKLKFKTGHKRIPEIKPSRAMQSVMLMPFITNGNKKWVNTLQY